MAITVRCAECGQVYQVPDRYAGRKGKCKCGASMTAPAALRHPTPPGVPPHAHAPGQGQAPSQPPVPGAHPQPPSQRAADPPAAHPRTGNAPVPRATLARPQPAVTATPPRPARSSGPKWGIVAAVLAIALGSMAAVLMRGGLWTRLGPTGEASAPARPAPGQGAPAGPGTPQAAATAPAALAGAVREWPGWLGPARDGKSADTGLLKAWPTGGPPLLWRASGIGKGYSSVAVSGGMVYTTGLSGNTLVVSALDSSGRRVWSAQHGPEHHQYPGGRATPTLDGGSLYITSGMGLIGCYGARTGARRWTRDMRELGGSVPNWGYAESVLIRDNLAIVTPGGNGCITALDKNTGQTIWRSSGFSAPAHYGSCIAVTEGDVPMIIAGTGAGILGVSANGGTLLWQNDFAAGNTANCPTPAYSDGYVFWANGYGRGGISLKLSAAGGSVRADEAWRTRQMDCHHGGYVIVGGYIYGNHGDGWSCLDLRTGATRWSARGVGKGSLCYADGMLYLFGERNGLAGLAPASPAGLQLTGQFNVAGSEQSWAHPVVAGKRLYLRYGDNLYCFDVAQR